MKEHPDTNSEKLFYTMGEVAEMFDVNPSLIRFWEKNFDILKPHKNRKGNRLFTPQDIENLKIIYHLVRENGMTLEGARRRLAQNPQGICRDAEITERLQSIRAWLLQVKTELIEQERRERQFFTPTVGRHELNFELPEPTPEDVSMNDGIDFELPPPLDPIHCAPMPELSLSEFEKREDDMIRKSLIQTTLPGSTPTTDPEPITSQPTQPVETPPESNTSRSTPTDTTSQPSLF